MLSTRIALPILAASLLIGLSACGSKDEKKPASQVAAKVNSEEISVHQINFVLGRSNAAAIPPEQAPRVRREILDKLIDQQLAVEKAVEKKIDRSPEVLMAIEAARREILARAYIEQIAAAQPKPTLEEAKKYIAEHPQLFAERRIYNIQEIVVPASSNVLGNLREMVAASKSMEDIAIWLKSKDIKFTGGSATRPAEQIPLDLLPKVHALKDGQGLLLENAQSITIMRLAASQSAPVTEAVAIPRVQQFLGNQRAGEAAASELKQLKANAKIAYMGEFAESAAAPATAATPAAVPATAPAKAPAPAAEKKPASSNIEKGVAGLK
ncbi:MAG: EpsD family peptidyl-prolyl cis-trans isomerase [Propionivibrio sp.]|uniref:EpsD family peptidyl-prolyl cis-trans isomerase n=1 Tax=Propionivibrio sp. TaxID=2212460 RepID=UPI001A5CD66D|nr:EpsD family peptidyl-prolyl cis-trans isomerase [Propionivibrio sp.]MBL8414029.1 EpsD family peptidyl-prolyl cis-trans isomerase [Propionivibrio sp.]